MRYLKGFFFVDVLATFPFYLIFNSQVTIAKNIGKLGRLPKMIKFLRAVRLLKLLRVYKLQQYIVRLEVEYNIHHGISRLLKIMLMVLLVTHIVGCFWFLIGLSGGTNIYNGGWMFRFEFDTQDTIANYVASLYWAFSTLTTVGYGDISARTPQEQIYSMIMMLLGVSWYAYVVSCMSTVMSTFNAQNKAVRDKMMCVNEFARAAKLPRELSKNVREFFEFKLSRSQRAFLMSDHYDADELLYEMSSSLRSEVILFMHRELISKIPFFHDKIPQFQADMISLLQPVVVQMSDYIVKEGDSADEMYFLIKGKAAVYYGNKLQLNIEQGSYFGEIGCLMGGIRRAGVKALTTCELQSLSKRNLNNLLAEYPDVAKELKTVANQRATAVQMRKRNHKQRKKKLQKQKGGDGSMKKSTVVNEKKKSVLETEESVIHKINSSSSENRKEDITTRSTSIPTSSDTCTPPVIHHGLTYDNLDKLLDKEMPQIINRMNKRIEDHFKSMLQELSLELDLADVTSAPSGS